jgi:hypothetical protein
MLDVHAPFVLRVQAPRRHHRSARRHFDSGKRVAALRAVTAARLYASGSIATVAKAALSCGSNRRYVEAAITLLKSENTTLLNAVVGGQVPLLAAAAQVTRLADLVDAFRKANAGDRVSFAQAVGPTVLFDTSLVPAL